MIKSRPLRKSKISRAVILSEAEGSVPSASHARRPELILRQAQDDGFLISRFRKDLKSSLLFAFVTLAFSLPAFAQMKSGEAMKNYEAVFGVKNNQHGYAYDVTLIESAPPGNVLAPEEQPAFTFLFRNNTAEAIHADAHIDVLSYGTREIPGDIWTPDLFKMADLPAIPITVDLPAHGSQVIKVEAHLPATLGGYAFVADLGASGRRFATSCVRTFAPTQDREEYPKQALDDVGPDILQKLGVRAIRMGVAYVPASDPHYAEAMAALDAKLRDFASRNITVMLMFLAGDGAPQPFGRGRPHLDANGVMLDTKQDLAWLPSSDADFQNFVATICKQNGWPKGPVTAVELWNEPWDGISISGWGADEPRFLEIYTSMAKGVEAARQEGAQILLGGCDSSTNTMDKLFADGKDAMLKWFDVCTIHYQGICTPVLYKAWINRQGGSGRVKVWDTESWVANTDDRVATVVAGDRAAGYDRNMGVFGGNISTETKATVTLPDGTKKQVDTFHAWSTAAAMGAAQHFIGERDFDQLLFKNGLPWVILFHGLAQNPDDGTAVVVGDLGEAFGKDNMLFRTVHLLKNASLTLQDAGGEFTLYDFYGNPVPETNHAITVPLDQRGFFLRTNGAKGSFDRLTQAIATARIEGIDPVQIVAHDLLTPIDQKPSLHLTFTNMLNRDVTGMLQVSLGDLKLNVPVKEVLLPHETDNLLIPITGGNAVDSNTYPLTVSFAEGGEATVTHTENLHVNLIAKRTIAIDGNLDDWKGVLPQAVFATSNQGPSLEEAAWLPFNKFSTTQKPGFATGYLAYDEKNFYFAAKIADNTRSPGTIRYEKRNDDDYFYPPVSYEYDPLKTLLKKDETWQESSREKSALFLPNSKDRSFTVWSSVSKVFAVDFDLPKDTYKQVSLYFVDWDSYKTGRRYVTLEVHDAATDKLLAKSFVSEYGLGTYVNVLLAGKVRLVLRSQSTFLSASLSGIFFDPATTEKQPQGEGSAQFLGTDLTTGADWSAKYGRDGYEIAGVAPALPAYAKVTMPEIIEKKDHTWPEGVRRYSYRKRPDVPFGGSPNKFDNVQIAFNVVPEDQKSDMVPFPHGTMTDFLPHSDTDYEYALNKVADASGGGTEIWRCLAPTMPRKSFFPRQVASALDGPVKDGQLVVTTTDNTRTVEAAIPWSEIPLVHDAMLAGRPIKFSFRVNDNDGPTMELAEQRSVSKKNPYTFHPDWAEHWSNEVEFSFEK